MGGDRLVHREQNFYNQRWAHAELSAVEAERAAVTVAAIPRDCKCILDVGCGDGRVTKEVRRAVGCYVVGFDLSTRALARLDLPKCCGSAAELPFAGSSFDLVMATEIMEHLPEEPYRRMLGELARVAGRYILTTVPNCEDLQENTALCAACGAHFHIWSHMRAYTPELMESLFPGFKVKCLSSFGSPVDKYNTLLLWLRHRVARAWAWEENRTVCYHCHATRPQRPRWPFLARVCDFLNARFWAPYAKRASWILTVYVRNGS